MMKRYTLWFIFIFVMVVLLANAFSFVVSANDGNSCRGETLFFNAQLDVESNSIAIRIASKYDSGRLPGHLLGSYQLWSVDGIFMEGGELDSMRAGGLPPWNP